MKKGHFYSLLLLFVVGIFLTGCQGNENQVSETSTTAEPALADTNSEQSESKAEAEATKNSEEHNHVHNEGDEHSHSHEAEKQKEIYSGIFEDDEVKDRTLSDWNGDWQSVYPYLVDGTLDEVFQHKAETKKDKTFDEYKEYYQTGYETDVERIVIKDNTMTFYKNDEEKTGEYRYHGYEILTYESGKKGVRYLFDLVGEAEGLPKHVQFSDHSIEPTKAHHYHIYFGEEDHDTLLQELDNWPTYFLSQLSGEEITKEMIAH